MFLKYILLLFISVPAFASCPSITLPSSFVEKEDLTLIGTDMTLKADGKKFASIEERVLKLASTFDLLDGSDQKIARARHRILTWGATIDITDCEQRPVATIKELVFKSLLSFKTQYEIYNPSGKLIAKSDKLEFFSTDFVFKTPEGVVAFKMHRPTFNWVTDKWEVTVVTPGKVDYRIALFVPAFKTSADNRARSEDDN